VPGLTQRVRHTGLRGNHTDLEKPSEYQAVLGYRLHTITAVASGGKDPGRGVRVQVIHGPERLT